MPPLIWIARKFSKSQHRWSLRVLFAVRNKNHVCKKKTLMLPLMVKLRHHHHKWLNLVQHLQSYKLHVNVIWNTIWKLTFKTSKTHRITLTNTRPWSKHLTLKYQENRESKEKSFGKEFVGIKHSLEKINFQNSWLKELWKRTTSSSSLQPRLFKLWTKSSWKSLHSSLRLNTQIKTKF